MLIFRRSNESTKSRSLYSAKRSVGELDRWKEDDGHRCRGRFLDSLSLSLSFTFHSQDTLADLLRVAGQRPGVPMVVCCSSRDELDAVCCAVSNLPFISLAALYSDLAEAERALVLDGFRQSTLHWNQRVVVQSGNDVKAVEEVEKKSHIVVVTDACLPLLTSGELPLSARVLINYELPTKKETYMRRMAACLAADGIVINMIVGGEVVTLKSLEESSNILIAEMPINISEIL